MARPATGSARWNAKKAYWEARVTIPGAGRKPAPLRGVPPCIVNPSAPPARCACESCTRARRVAQLVSDQARDAGMVPAEAGETWNEWHPRYLDVHDRLGKLTHGMKGSGETWVGARIGRMPMATLKREHIAAIRDAMTKAVLGGEVSAKRIMNVWSGIVVAPFSRAFTDDDPRYASVRVGPAASNPAAGIKPPVTKEQIDEGERERQPMYPHEFLRLLESEDVPAEAKCVYVVATYLYCRPQEFYALRWGDVDWEAREVRIRRKLDVRSGEEKPGTKSDAGIREVPIHPHLMPLLKALHKHRAADDARIIPMIGSARSFERFADQTRRHVKLAGIERRELVTGTDDHMPFDFRSWRTTGCTWLAMLGTDSYVIAQQAGHKSPETTWASYIKRGPDLRQRHGEPFPPLPAELLERVGARVGFGLVLDPGPESLCKSGAELRRGRDSKSPAARRETTSSDPPRDRPSIAEDAEKNASEASAVDDLVIAVDRAEEATHDAETRRSESAAIDPDAALRQAIRVALDAGQDALAEELMGVLRKRKPAPVVDLVGRKTNRA